MTGLTRLTQGPDAASWFVAAIVVVVAMRFRPQAPARSLSGDDDDVGRRLQVTSEVTSGQPSTLGTHDRLGPAHFVWPRQRRARDGELARWCDDVARAVRGGATLHAALRSVPAPRQSQLSPALGDLMQHLARGQALSESVRAVAQTAPATKADGDGTGTADAALIFTVLEQCATSGGSSAEPLERAAGVLRSRDAARGEVAAQSASARMSAIVLTLLPVAMLALLLSTSASTREAIATPFGVGITTAGLVLNFVGWRWMGRLINGVRT